jgi:hypothetical protein
MDGIFNLCNSGLGHAASRSPASIQGAEITPEKGSRGNTATTRATTVQGCDNGKETKETIPEEVLSAVPGCNLEKYGNIRNNHRTDTYQEKYFGGKMSDVNRVCAWFGVLIVV